MPRIGVEEIRGSRAMLVPSGASLAGEVLAHRLQPGLPCHRSLL